MTKRSPLLYPFTLLYGCITSVRNFMFDKGLLTSVKHDIPVICVGNITTGGTGKTPHTEYIIKLLKDRYKVAVISRGYKRKSIGFKLADKDSTVDDIGDEPLQIFRKYPDITLAVDADRNRGIETIRKERPEVDLIVMDDGFQHRSVKPGLSIVLSDYNRPITEDSLLPYGNLREGKHNLRRADLLVITKTPKEVDPSKNDGVIDNIRKYYKGDIVRTSLVYQEFVPVFAKSPFKMAPALTKKGGETGLILITGVANPVPLIEHLNKEFKEIIHLSYPDHYRFTGNDIRKICKAFDKLKTKRKFILTTEKDAVRLREFSEITRPIQPFVFFIRMAIDFVGDDKVIFDKKIEEYVGKNQ